MKYNKMLTAVFCGFLGLIFTASVILPDKSFSELENRNLSKVPQISWESIQNGKFMADAEDYTADHIVGRDFWVALKAWCERLSGKQENNGAYFTNDGALINRVEEPDLDKLLESVGHVNKLVDKVKVPVHFGIIPTAAAIRADALPVGAPTADELAIIRELYAASGAENLDLAGALLEQKDQYIYYNTDHHWTSLGAFYGANAIFRNLGLEELKLGDYTPVTVSDSFNGTTFSSSGVRWLSPDLIQIFVPEEGKKVTAYFTGKPEEGELYVEEKLEVKDKYAFFLGGNQPLCVIENEGVEGEKVLVVRDSYSDSLAPFLAERFSEVHLFDLRYNLTPISQYVEQNGIDRVVVLYSFSNFVQGQNIFALGR
jgi:hypothetical protein